MARKKEFTVVYPDKMKEKFKGQIFRSKNKAFDALGPGEDFVLEQRDTNTDLPEDSPFQHMLVGYWLPNKEENGDIYCNKYPCHEY